MKHILILLLSCLAGSLVARPVDLALEVLHLPPTGAPLENPPYPYMWYYRTEVHNKSSVPLKIVWFEAYTEAEGTWYANNVLGRTMRGRDFSEWYTEGDKTEEGIIPPGGVAVCDVNWHGSEESTPFGAKWAFIAVDDRGNDYYVEAIVPTTVPKLVQSPAKD